MPSIINALKHGLKQMTNAHFAEKILNSIISLSQ